MNVFFLGNGFDLRHQLPTSYQNFLNTLSYLSTHQTAQIQTVGDVFKLISAENSDSFIASSYKKLSQAYNSTPLPQEEKNEMVEIAKNNEWFRFFSNRKIAGEKWIDFEKEIKYVISVISYALGIEKKTVDPSDDDIVEIFEAFSYGELYKTFPPDYESSMANRAFLEFRHITDVMTDHYRLYLYEDYTQIHSGKIHQNTVSINIEKIIDNLLISLYAFTKLLSKYLVFFVEKPLKYMAENGKAAPDKLFSFADYVISLNYTHTFETLYNCAETYHIHGETNNLMVLGTHADSSDRIESINTRLIGFKKYFQRVSFLTDCHYMEFVYTQRKRKERRQEKIKLLTNSQELRKLPQKERNDIANELRVSETWLFVFGHSLDETDKDIIIELFDLADTIIVFFYQPEDMNNYVKNLITIYGKEVFDILRINKHLRFYPADVACDFCEHMADIKDMFVSYSIGGRLMRK